MEIGTETEPARPLQQKLDAARSKSRALTLIVLLFALTLGFPIAGRSFSGTRDLDRGLDRVAGHFPFVLQRRVVEHIHDGERNFSAHDLAVINSGPDRVAQVAPLCDVSE